MKNVNLWIALHLTLICLAQATSLIYILQPGRFARQRYMRSRKVLNSTGRLIMHPVINNEPILDFVAIVNLYGYSAEEHSVTTADGYKLLFHRITGRDGCRSRTTGKPVVYMQHGMLASSDTWILNGPEKDLAYMLVDAGYDVWLGNARGNTYSRLHTKFCPDFDTKFWRFSFHEIAMYDVPAMIDYILETTGQRSLVYLGHSMGSTISYVLLSMRPEYNAKMQLVISMAPVAFWHARPPRPFVKFLMDNTPAIKNFVTRARINEVFPLTSMNALMGRAVCSEGSVLYETCRRVLSYVFGYNPKQFNSTVVSNAMAYLPAGASMQTLLHYSQNIISGDFTMYNYDVIKNMAMYKKRSPPAYNLKNVKAPVALIYGAGDGLVSPANVIELSKKLPKLVTVEPVPDERFTHMDFLFSRDLKVLLNDRIAELIFAYSKASEEIC